MDTLVRHPKLQHGLQRATLVDLLRAGPMYPADLKQALIDQLGVERRQASSTVSGALHSGLVVWAGEQLRLRAPGEPHAQSTINAALRERRAEEMRQGRLTPDLVRQAELSLDHLGCIIDECLEQLPSLRMAMDAHRHSIQTLRRALRGE